MTNELRRCANFNWLMFGEFLLVALVIIYASYITIPDRLVNVAMSADSTHLELKSKSDFIIFYTAGRIANSAQPNKIYDPDTQRKIQADLTGYYEDDLTPYFYPPQTLIFFKPLAHFPLNEADHIWHACNAFFTFLLIGVLYYAGIYSKLGGLLLTTILVVTSNIWIGVMANGQPTILVALGLFGCQLLARYKHPILAGVLLLLTAFKPQLFAAPVCYLLIIYGRSLWISIGCVSVAVIGIGSAFFDISIWHTYMETVMKASNSLDLVDAIMLMCNVRTLALLLFGEKNFNLINNISTFLWLANILAAGFLAFLARRKTEEVKELGLALVVVLVCVFSPYLFSNSLIILLITLGYLIKYIGLRGLYPIIIAHQFFNWIAIEYPAEINPIVWVPAQFLLIIWTGIAFYKACFNVIPGVPENKNGS